MKTKNAKGLKCEAAKPALRSDGTCSACAGGWLCQFHKEETGRNEAQRAETLKHAAHAARQAEICRVCARYELESDEFFTREEKAISLIGRGFA